MIEFRPLHEIWDGMNVVLTASIYLCPECGYGLRRLTELAGRYILALYFIEKAPSSPIRGLDGITRNASGAY